MKLRSLVLALVLAACGGSSNGAVPPQSATERDVTGTWLATIDLTEGRKIVLIFDLRTASNADIYVRWDMLDGEKDVCLRYSGRWVYANSKLTFELSMPESGPIGRTVGADFPRENMMRLIDAKGKTVLLERGTLPTVADCRSGPLK